MSREAGRQSLGVEALVSGKEWRHNHGVRSHPNEKGLGPSSPALSSMAAT